MYKYVTQHVQDWCRSLAKQQNYCAIFYDDLDLSAHASTY